MRFSMNRVPSPKAVNTQPTQPVKQTITAKEFLSSEKKPKADKRSFAERQRDYVDNEAETFIDRKFQAADPLPPVEFDMNILGDIDVSGVELETPANTIETQEIPEFEQNVEFKNKYIQWHVDIHTMYCAKTGAPIGTRPESMVRMLAASGQSELAIAASLITGAGCSPIWQSTAGENLDWLQENDPCGYLSYSLSLACRAAFPGWSKASNGWKSTEAYLEYQQSIIKTHWYARQLTVQQVHDLNLILADWNTAFGQCKVNILHKLPHTYIDDAAPDVVEKFAKTLRDMLKQRVKELSHFDYIRSNPIIFGNVIARIGDGYSNVKSQKSRKPKRKTKKEEIGLIMDSLNFGNTDLDMPDLELDIDQFADEDLANWAMDLEEVMFQKQKQKKEKEQKLAKLLPQENKPRYVQSAKMTTFSFGRKKSS